MKESTMESRLASALRERHDAIVYEPLPKRWVKLIHELNERERSETEARQVRAAKKDRPH
jgi:hypothetical protein